MITFYLCVGSLFGIEVCRNKDKFKNIYKFHLTIFLCGLLYWLLFISGLCGYFVINFIENKFKKYIINWFLN